MPEVPVRNAGLSVQQRMPSIIASGRDFANIGPAAAALRSVSSNMMTVARATATNEEKRRQAQEKQDLINDTRWVNESVFQLKNELNEWHAQPENHGREDYPDITLKHSSTKVQEYLQNAPSQRAADRFKAEMQTYTGSRFNSALDQAFKTKVNNTIESLDKQTQSALAAFRSARTLENNQAIAEAFSDLEMIKSGIDDSFGDITPKLARTMKAEVENKFILEVAPTSPEAAQHILDNSDSIESEDRVRLKKYIESNVVAHDQQEFIAFENTRDDAIALSMHTGEAAYIPLDDYLTAYDGDKAKANRNKNSDDRRIQANVMTKEFMDRVTPYNAKSQLEALEEMRKGVSGAVSKTAYDNAVTLVNRNLQQQTSDPKNYLMANNPELISLNAQYSDDLPEEEKLVLVNKINEATLRYQGRPPDNIADPEIRKMYLGLPELDQHLISKSEANDIAPRINGVGPDQAVEQWQQLAAQYPNVQHQIKLINDLQSLPDSGRRLREEYQLLINSIGAWWQDTYIGALNQAKELGKLTKETASELDKYIESNPSWQSFKASRGAGELDKNIPEIAGFYAGINTYARALVFEGKSEKEAVNTAVKHLLDESMGFANINDRSTAIARIREDGTERTDEDIRDLDRKLEVALNFFNADEIDISTFPKATQMLSGKALQDELQRLIWENGYYRTTEDGQGVILYITDDTGLGTQLTDKNGDPFKIMFDDLPDFTQTIQDYQVIGMGAPAIMPGATARTMKIPMTGEAVRSQMKKGRSNWPWKIDWIQ